MFCINKNIQLIILILMVFVGSANNAFSHNKIIKGRVTTNNGEKTPLVGARVRIANSVLGGLTDKDGYFIIKRVPDGTHEVIITSIGMQQISYTVEMEHVSGDEFELNVAMVEDPIRTKNIVVTAKRSERIYDDIPVKMSVVSDRVFQATSSISLREGLNFQPGLRTEVNCQNCGFSQVRMNGLEGKYSQILIDGKPIYSALNSVYGLDQIPINMVDRIEVVRGGGSSLSGGSAIAGVINIITKKPSENKFNFDYTQNFIDDNSPESSIGINGSIINNDQNLGVNIFGLSNFRKEYDANNDGYSDIARLNVKSFGSRGFYKMSFNSIIQAEFHISNHQTRGGDSIFLPPHQANITEAVEHNSISGQIGYEQYFNNSLDKISLYTSFQITDRNSYYGSHQDLNAYGRTDNETWATGLQYTRVFDNFFGYHIISTGYEFTSDYVKDQALGYNRSIIQSAENHGGYIQDDWTVSDAISVVIGGRADKHNLLDKAVISPRANVLVKPVDNLSLRGNFSTGFRPPQAFDEDLHIAVAGGERVLIQQAADLETEYSLSYGVSADYSFGFFGIPLAISMEYFSTKLDDAFVLIDNGSDGLGNTIFIKDNGEGATVSGATAELEIRFSKKFNVKSGITLQKSIYDAPIAWSQGNAADGSEDKFSKQIFKTPDLYGYFTIDYDFLDNLELNLSAVYTGAMYLPHYAGFIDNDVLKKTDPFMDMNIKFKYSVPVKDKIDISIGVKNIFNKFQDDLDRGINRDSGYIYGPAKPRTIFFGISTGI